MQRRRLTALIAAVPLWPAQAGAVTPATPAWEDFDWFDAARGRSLPLRMRWPAGDDRCALVLFSHGLGGDRSGGAVWADAWQAAGFAVLNLQHPGSDSGIWQDGARGVRAGMQPAQYLARVADTRFVLDELARRRDAPGWRRLRHEAIGFSGHSFGARLTQALAGESMPGAARSPLGEPRLRAFIAFSPGFSERRGGDLDDAARQRFAAIDRPFLCITGTRDEAPIVGGAANASRLAVFGGLPAGAKAELVLDGADHMTFAGQATPIHARRGAFARDPGAIAHEPDHHALVARISIDWWRWRLLGDAQARQGLQHPLGLAAGDRWRLG
jgi:predicted dienelactone hydrolase